MSDTFDRFKQGEPVSFRSTLLVPAPRPVLQEGFAWLRPFAVACRHCGAAGPWREFRLAAGWPLRWECPG